jgi:uncharacterized SAM-binding protein YcdF (DUF218 family)
MSKSTLIRLASLWAIVLATGLAILGLCWWNYGWSFVEKLLTRMAMPCGVIWLCLLCVTLGGIGCGQRRRACLMLVLLLFYWTAGSTYTSNLFIGLLEGRYQPVDPQGLQEFDMVIVLGGSTFFDTQGNVWLSPHGDRVMLATRLFGQGKAKRLVTSGRLYHWHGEHGVDMSEATERIWKDVRIPTERITQIGGRNTTEEMQEIRRLLGENPPDRIGLLTSAFHMPRAERLARQYGLNLTPIPAGFLGVAEPLPLSLIPSGYGFFLTELATKEFLAAVLQR